MKIKTTLLASLLLSASLSPTPFIHSAVAADVLYPQQAANDPGFPDDGDIPPQDVFYSCSRYGGPSGWVVTGRGSNSCTGFAKTFKFEPPSHNQKICSNGPNPPARYYRKDVQVAYNTCGTDSGVDYYLYTIGDSNWIISLSDPTIQVCAPTPVPSYHLNLGVSYPNQPINDFVITRRNVDNCINELFYEVSKYEATLIPAKNFGTGPVYAPALKMRVCTNQTLPQYVQVTPNSASADNRCDAFIGDGRGQSQEIVIDYQSICTSSIATTTAKSICLF